MSRKLLRQGDVLLVAVDSIPSSADVIPPSDRGAVLAEGERTGHAHRIASRHANLYRSENDARFLRVMGPAPVALQHEEHTAVQIPPGDYQIVIHHEYQPGELARRVED